MADPNGTDFSNPKFTGPILPRRQRSLSRTSRSSDGGTTSSSGYSTVASSTTPTTTTTSNTTPTLPSAASPLDQREELLPQLPTNGAKDMVSYKVVVPLYSSSAASFFFPVFYARPSLRDKLDHRGTPQAINDEFHPEESHRLPLDVVAVQKNNLNRMGLYKIGAGAVAFKSVMSAFEAAGLEFTTSNSDFNIIWAKRATPHTLASLNAYQKVNHFPATFGVGRKDRLAYNVRRMQRYFGEDNFDIIPRSFLIPREQGELEQDAARHSESSSRSPLIYIVKPSASSCGRGIQLYRGVPPMPRDGREMVCQRYIGNPFLIYGRKFDLRLYCVITSFDPLRIYLFDEGLVRFAAEKYQGPDKDLDNIQVHLTNYSVNKTAELSRDSHGKDYDTDDPLDIKWCISDFRQYLAEHHPLGEAAWDRIQAECDDVVIKTFLSIESDVVSRIREQCRDRTGRNCFELFGLDLMADDKLKVRLIEVNIMPSLATGSSLDKAVKARMLAHLLTLVRAIPHRRDVELDPLNSEGEFVPHGAMPSSPERCYKFGKMPFPPVRITEKPLLATFNQPDDADSMISVDERLMIMESEEELHCAGGFRCIYPVADTVERYLPFFLHGVKRNNYLLASAVLMKERRGDQHGLFDSSQ